MSDPGATPAASTIVGEGTILALRRVGLVLGPVLALVVYLLMPAGVERDGALVAGASDGARQVAAVATLMGVWWLTEALPLEATALVPLALFPVLGVLKPAEAARPYADPIVFLFLGGMLLGRAIERWGLHTRIALGVVGAFGARPSRLVGGFLAATALVSMWVSNTAAAIMMLPIGASVTTLVLEQLAEKAPSPGAKRQGARFALCLMLAIAYGSSIGGVGTLIGTPPISQLAGYVGKNYTPALTFASWLWVGLPMVVVGVLMGWFLLTRVIHRISLGEVEGVRAVIAWRRRELGPLRGPERATLAIFLLVALAWVSIPLVHGAFKGSTAGVGARIAAWTSGDRLGDAVIAMAGALLLFIIPARGKERRALLTWAEAERVPWGILLIFGGGFALAEAMKQTGLDAFIARGADALAGMPLPLLLFTLALTATFLSEFMSNTALTAVALQVAAPMATRLGLPPMPVFAAVTLGASLAFMLPAGTPPNAIVFASGHVTIRSMAKAGLWLNLAFAILGTLVVYGTHELGLLPALVPKNP